MAKFSGKRHGGRSHLLPRANVEETFLKAGRPSAGVQLVIASRRDNLDTFDRSVFLRTI